MVDERWLLEGKRTDTGIGMLKCSERIADRVQLSSRAFAECTSASKSESERLKVLKSAFEPLAALAAKHQSSFEEIRLVVLNTMNGMMERDGSNENNAYRVLVANPEVKKNQKQKRLVPSHKGPTTKGYSKAASRWKKEKKKLG